MNSKLVRTETFSKGKYVDGAPIIIYGAGACGLLTLEGLRLIGLTADFFVDKTHANGKVKEIEIIPPAKLTNFPEAHILIASSNFFEDMLNYLVAIGHKKYYNVQSLISNEQLLAGKSLEEQFDLQNLIITYKYTAAYKHCSNRTILSTLDIVITEKCNMRCRDCANAMQYYAKPKNCDILLLKESLDRFLNCVDYLPKAFVIGGEPFLNSELHRVLDWYGEHPKIGSIWIFTNGSIIPNRRNLDAMKRAKVMVRLSDYGPLVKNLQKFEECMQREQILYRRYVCDIWHDLGSMRDRGYGPEKIRNVYSACECRDIFTLLNGRLYRCPWSAHGDNLGIIRHRPGDYVDLMDHSQSDELTADKIRRFTEECEQIAACGYCNGRGPSTASVPAAIQMKKPCNIKELYYDEPADVPLRSS
jgi:sulfatase maturation enzyme AslB (radical SAM superfamily)